MALTAWSASLGSPLLLEVADKMLPFSDRAGTIGLYLISSFLLAAWRRPLGVFALAFAVLLLVEDATFARSPLADDVSRELGWTYLHWDAIQAAGIVLATIAGWKVERWRVGVTRADLASDQLASTSR